MVESATQCPRRQKAPLELVWQNEYSESQQPLVYWSVQREGEAVEAETTATLKEFLDGKVLVGLFSRNLMKR